MLGRKIIKKYTLNILVSLGTLLFMGIIMEITARIVDGKYTLKNYLNEAETLFQAAYPVQYAPDLGWIPKPGASGEDNIWSTTVSILDDGIRSNGNKYPYPQGNGETTKILTVGDSFTFGDQVSDHETWPAILEILLGGRVINAGVFGYGIDQAFLRAKKLIEKYKPNALIFSFISTDISRCELLEQMGAGKPYFEVSGETLLLKNVPVPPPSKYRISKFRETLSYSYFIHKCMLRLSPYYWLQGIQLMTKAHSQGEQVTCLIFQELEHIAKTTPIQIYLLVQYIENPTPSCLQMVDRVLSCVNRELIHVVDLRYALLEEKTQNYAKYQSYFNGHMTYEGNYFVALNLKGAMSEE
jgi:hypothetical protein